MALIARLFGRSTKELTGAEHWLRQAAYLLRIGQPTPAVVCCRMALERELTAACQTVGDSPGGVARCINVLFVKRVITRPVELQISRLVDALNKAAHGTAVRPAIARELFAETACVCRAGLTAFHERHRRAVLLKRQAKLCNLLANDLERSPEKWTSV